MDKTYIKVFVTKNMKFRARIIEIAVHGPNNMYEVTLGGKSWKLGVGQAHKEIISNKCEGIIESLKKEFKEAYDLPSKSIK